MRWIIPLVLLLAAACGDGEPAATAPSTTQAPVTTQAPATTGATTTAATTTEAATITVTIVGTPVEVRSFAFDPEAVTIAAGDSITFVFKGGTHTATATDGTWASGTMRAGDVFTLTFEEAGTYSYFCEFHPQQMRAEITVTG